MIKFTSSVKYMFLEESSDSDSSDSDEEKEKIRRRKATRRRPLRVSFPASEPIDKPKRTTRTMVKENGLFMIDSTGGGGSVGLKNRDMDPDKEIHTQLDPGVDMTSDLYIDLDVLNRNRWIEKEGETNETEDSRASELVTEIMKKATFKPSMEKNPSMPRVSKMELKRRRKAEREKTKGREWFNMPATELTEERKRDLEIMQLRDAIDPKRHYRSDDRTVLPKYFQVGTVIEHPADFYHSRIPRKERKQTIVDELLADADLQKRSKRKYAEIQQEKLRYRPADRGDRKKDKSKKRKLKA